MNTAFVMTSLLGIQRSFWRRYEVIEALIGLAGGSLVEFVSNCFEQVWFGQKIKPGRCKNMRRLNNRLAADDKFGPVAPNTVFSVGKRDLLGITGVPRVLRHAYFLDRAVAVERRQWWPRI